MITLSIIIYVASPLDYARYRHAALYLEYGGSPENGDTNANADTNAETPSQLKSSVAEIVGSTGFFTFVERLNWEPPISSTGEGSSRQSATCQSNPMPLPGVFYHCAVHCLLVLHGIYLRIHLHLCICICISMHADKEISLDTLTLTLSSRYSTRHTRRCVERIRCVYNTTCKPQSESRSKPRTRSKSQSGSNQQN